MKQIYKVLISILVISMLAVTAISAVTGPYTGCVSKSATKYDIKGIFYYFQSGSTPMSPCKIGDDQISLYDKVQVDSIVQGLTSIINNLGDAIDYQASRITNLENTYAGVYSATFIKEFEDTEPSGIGNGMYIPFYLPVDSYIYVTGTGKAFGDTQTINNLRFKIDDNISTHKSRVLQSPTCPTCSSNFFSISDGFKLTAGNHIIYIFGDSSMGISDADMVVIATEKGSYSCDACNY